MIVVLVSWIPGQKVLAEISLAKLLFVAGDVSFVGFSSYGVHIVECCLVYNRVQRNHFRICSFYISGH